MYNNGEDKYYDNHCEYNEHLINKVSNICFYY